jgi:phosphatidate phosphatase APP1
LARAGVGAEALVERIRRRRRHQGGPVQIVPYRGFGRADELFLSGRVIEDRGILPADEAATRWANLRDNWRRFGSRELVGVRVAAEFAGVRHVAATDEEGYFQLRFQPAGPPDGAPWQIVRLELLDLPLPAEGLVRAAAEVLVPPPSARFGLISDIDDTILQTYATDLLKMAALTMFRNARTRLPFEGVTGLYQALVAGASGEAHNPVFYVSSSPWNLYDFLVEFMAHNGLPAGPLFLTDYGFERDRLFKQSHAEHKLHSIEQIMSTYPQLPFVLSGDSGQHDPEIYLEAAQRFPGRVPVIYIRHVSDDRRAQEVTAIGAAASQVGAELLLVPDSAAAAADALRRGLIGELPA